MSDYIYREVYLTEDRRVEPIPVTENSKVPIRLRVMDATITGTALACAYNEKTGRFMRNRSESNVSNNTVTIIPDNGLFVAGNDKLQVRFFIPSGAGITRDYNVVCAPDFSQTGSIPDAAEVIPLVERAEQAASNSSAYAQQAQTAETNANAAKVAAQSAKADAESARDTAESLKNQAQTAETNAANSASKAEEERRYVENLKVTLTEDAIENALGYKPPRPSDIPNVPDWALQPSKPGYSAQEVGAVATGDVVDANVINSSADLSGKVASAAALRDFAVTPVTYNITCNAGVSVNAVRVGHVVTVSGMISREISDGIGLTVMYIQDGLLPVTSYTVPLGGYGNQNGELSVRANDRTITANKETTGGDAKFCFTMIVG